MRTGPHSDRTFFRWKNLRWQTELRFLFAPRSRMFTRLQISRNLPYGMTGLELRGPDSELHVKFLSRSTKAERRLVILSFIRQIRPWIGRFTEATMDHSRDGLVRDRRSIERSHSILEQATNGSGPTEIGFHIRMRRLELGFTQAELAEKVGIARSHLSSIERGTHHPRSITRSRLELVLGPGAGPSSEKNNPSFANVGFKPDTEAPSSRLRRRGRGQSSPNPT
jgi:DNA-binding XRE family transcriptional regulator